ncbi:hypothetical protein [Streptomyces sp. PR69]|uniref:hypothetical protein n=1 Tax=Streptomyces sp. PR69 TaxID=2984950 RepID=UPI00226436C2|nr:hypothetical protein [Streptomyces sp. PR69]
MKTRKRIGTAVVSAACAVAMTFTGVSQAQAAVNTDSSVPVVAEEVSPSDVAELATYLEAIVDGEHLDEFGNFDYDATAAKYGTEFADALKAENATYTPASGKRVKRSYTTCLLKAVGLGGLGGATSAITAKLKKRHFQDAARLIIKEAAKRGIKVAVKGGVAGMAAALGAYAIWCATPWAD